MKTLTLAAAQITCPDGKSSKPGPCPAMASRPRAGRTPGPVPRIHAAGLPADPRAVGRREPFDGPTTRWLAETARRLGIYVGTSFLEAEAAFPQYIRPGRTFRQDRRSSAQAQPIAVGGVFFQRQRGAPYLDTDLGRIGVGICFDNHTYEVASADGRQQIDLMLMPHSYCTPTAPQDDFASRYRPAEQPAGRVARLYNEWFGVPVLMCNKSGAWSSPVPDAMLGEPKDFRFSGRSVLLDADGALCGELGDEEAVLTGTARLDPSLKKHGQPPKYSRYIYPGSPGREIIRLMEWRGGLSYTFGSLRKQKAAAVART